MYCFDQPSVSFSMPAIDHLMNYQPQIAQQPFTHLQSPSLPPILPYQSHILEHTTCLSPLVYYEPELDGVNQRHGTACSPESSTLSPNSISPVNSNYNEIHPIKARDLLLMSDTELEKLSIRQLNSILAFGVSIPRHPTLSQLF